MYYKQIDKYGINTTMSDEDLEIYMNTEEGKKLFGINIDFKSCFKTSFDQYELVLITSKSSRGTLAQRIVYFDTSQTSVSITDLDETFFTPIDPVVLQSEKKQQKSRSEFGKQIQSYTFATRFESEAQGLNLEGKIAYQKKQEKSDQGFGKQIQSVTFATASQGKRF